MNHKKQKLDYSNYLHHFPSLHICDTQYIPGGLSYSYLQVTALLLTEDYYLRPRNSVIQKPVFIQLVKKGIAIYETRWFITLFNRYHHFVVSSIIQAKSVPQPLVIFPYDLPHLNWVLWRTLLGFLNTALFTFLITSYASNMLLYSRPPWFDL